MVVVDVVAGVFVVVVVVWCVCASRVCCVCRCAMCSVRCVERRSCVCRLCMTMKKQCTVPSPSLLIYECIWDVLDLYKNLKMTSYNNDPGTWAHRSRKSMQSHMQHAGLMPEANMLGSLKAGGSASSMMLGTATVCALMHVLSSPSRISASFLHQRHV